MSNLSNFCYSLHAMLSRATFDLNGVKHNVTISGIMDNQIFLNLHDPVDGLSKFRISVTDETFKTED